MRNLSALAALLVLLTASAVQGAVPGTMSFQGRLTDAVGKPLDTTIDITFALFDDSVGGSQLWQEVVKDVVVKEGIFEVLLGESTPLNREFFKDTGGWLRLTVGTGPAAETRLPFATTAYAFRAQYADTAERAGYADTAAFALGMGSSGWADDGTTVRLTTPTDNVGVGTSMPEDKLHIDNSTASGAAFLRAEASHATMWREAGIRIETPENRWHFRMDDYSHNNLPDSGSLSLRSQSSGIEAMTWTKDGKVGIQNTLPEYPLDVRSSAVAIYGRTTGGYGVAGVYGRAEVDGYGVMGTSTSGRGVYGASTSGFGGYFLGPTSYVSGNLGIGTETPTHKLTVNGTTGIQSAGVTKYHLGYYGGGLNFSETSVADYRLMLKDGGNVGIGTGSPTAKLHVAGNLKVNDTITAGGMWSTSITDEAGVASARTLEVDVTTSWHSTVSRQITTPGSGYVLALGTAKVTMDHTYNDLDNVKLGLSDAPDTCTSGLLMEYDRTWADESDFYTVPMTVSWIFPVDGEGVHTYYLVAKKFGPAQCWASRNHLCLVFVPTAYGSVAAPGPLGLEEGGDLPSEELRNSRESTVTAGSSPSMTDVMKELTALRHEVEALKKGKE